jgi:hypothetical protein
MWVYLPWASRLPSTYQEVEWIGSSATQYINTGYTPTINTEIETDLSWWSSQAEWWVFFWMTSNDKSSDWILWRIYSTNTGIFNPRFCNSSYDQCQISATVDTFHKVILKKNYCTVDGASWTLTTTWTPYQNNIYLFCGNNWWSAWRHTSVKFKSFKISESWTLQRNFIPCYRKSDNVIWMYDLVNNVFYTNSWSWTFTKWADIISDLKNAYIGEYVNFATQWPAPDGFHVPLTTEWQAVYDVWTALGGWSSDWTNFWITLKLPFAGYRINSSAGVGNQGTYGFYWSSSRSNADSASSLVFRSAALYPQYGYYRAFGFSVRCFKNSPAIPTSNWTKLYWTSIESWWIFWSSTDWLISLSSDWNTWVTIADKNLWATTVWNSWDTLSETNCGKYYQWGNNYGFPFTWSVTTSGTQVDASNYWPWNYYSSSTFITRSSSPYRWDTTDNWNLWWWEDGNVPV